MCMINCNLLTRKKDITCYKVLALYRKDFFERIHSPRTELGVLTSPIYKDTVYWKIGKVEHATRNDMPEGDVLKTYKEDSGKFSTKVSDIQNYVAESAFHTLKNIEDAFAYKNMLSRNLTTHRNIQRYVVTECRIPKDTKYVYVGTSVYGSKHPRYEGYASESLVVERIVEKLPYKETDGEKRV